MGRRSVAGILELVRSVISVLARRFRGQAILGKENFALPHQLHVLRCQRPSRSPQLFAIDRLVWILSLHLWHCAMPGATMITVEHGNVEEQLDAALDGVQEECSRLIGTGKKVIVE